MILVTGATGFLGKEVIVRLLTQYPNTQICLLVRAASGASAQDRGKQLLGELSATLNNHSLSEQVRILAGDVCLDDFGLSFADYNFLASHTNATYHLAASTILNQSLKDARYANVEGTKQIIRFSQLANKSSNNTTPLFYVSTAFVAGNTDGIVRPDDLRFTNGFKNYYEQSKAEAEQLVRFESTNIPCCIFRPSVIVGNSENGYTSSFNMLYAPIKVLITGIFTALPARPNTPFDVVPIDYVADALVTLSTQERSIGKCYHLTAGVGRETSPSEILELIIQAINQYGKESLRKFTMPIFIPEMSSLAYLSLAAAMAGVKNIEKVLGRHIHLLGKLVPFIPYMLRNPQFDNSSTISALDGILPCPPVFKHYAQTIFKYCLDTNWGKSKVPCVAS